MKQTSAIVVAILLGCTIIGAAIYLRPVAPAADNRAVATATPTVPGPAPAPPAPPVATAVPAPQAPPQAPQAPSASSAPSAPAPLAVSGPALEAKVRAALAKELVLWREQCWDVLTHQTPGPASTRFTLNMNFAADGSEIGRGMMSPRDAGRPDVNLCVNRLPASLLKLEPIGAPATIDLEIVLP